MHNKFDIVLLVPEHAFRKHKECWTEKGITSLSDIVRGISANSIGNSIGRQMGISRDIFVGVVNAATRGRKNFVFHIVRRKNHKTGTQ